MHVCTARLYACVTKGHTVLPECFLCQKCFADFWRISKSTFNLHSFSGYFPMMHHLPRSGFDGPMCHAYAELNALQADFEPMVPGSFQSGGPAPVNIASKRRTDVAHLSTLPAKRTRPTRCGKCFPCLHKHLKKGCLKNKVNLGDSMRSEG